jgi:NhaP-type Na+/H+ or K+/H+ antiporter
VSPTLHFFHLQNRDAWIFAARQACAVIVVLRAGLEVEVNKLQELGFSTLRLIFLPGLSETFVVAMLARIIFNMPIALCFTMGFIMAAVGPAIILSGMTDLTGKCVPLYYLLFFSLSLSIYISLSL